MKFVRVLTVSNATHQIIITHRKEWRKIETHSEFNISKCLSTVVKPWLRANTDTDITLRDRDIAYVKTLIVSSDVLAATIANALDTFAVIICVSENDANILEENMQGVVSDWIVDDNATPTPQHVLSWITPAVSREANIVAPASDVTNFHAIVGAYHITITSGKIQLDHHAATTDMRSSVGWGLGIYAPWGSGKTT